MKYFFLLTLYGFCGKLEGMEREGRKESRGQLVKRPAREDMVKTVVVDIFDLPGDPDHWVVTLRTMMGYCGEKDWYASYISTRVSVNLFDFIYIDTREKQLYLDRGPLLLYHLDSSGNVPPCILCQIQTSFENL